MDGTVAQVAAIKATNATKVNIALAPACGNRKHAPGQRAPEVTWQHSLQPWR